MSACDGGCERHRRPSIKDVWPWTRNPSRNCGGPPLHPRSKRRTKRSTYSGNQIRTSSAERPGACPAPSQESSRSATAHSSEDPQLRASRRPRFDAYCYIVPSHPKENGEQSSSSRTHSGHYSPRVLHD
ncbi:hypothetical protein V5799_005903 [Amblyomma americanum]|uniref:Uncharacterized protein n=1 Tax=Amblyomma americanum TaxID=6943 RepID=A0AAQ4DXX5_AMBAM